MDKLDQFLKENTWHFTSWDPITMDELKTDPRVQAIAEALDGDLANLKNKYKQCASGVSDMLNYGYFKRGGWIVNIKNFCKIYLIRERGDGYFRKVYAPNKGCIYSACGGVYHVPEIYEIREDE